MNIRNAFETTVRLARAVSQRLGQLPVGPTPDNREGEASNPPEIMAAGTFRPRGRGPGTFRVPPRRP